MTVTEKFESMLITYGMSTDQAKSVMLIAKEELNETADNYIVTWDSPYDEYPKPIYMALFLAVKPIALKWLNENKPQAWFKPIFETI